jgi:hypothetical protein
MTKEAKGFVRETEAFQEIKQPDGFFGPYFDRLVNGLDFIPS